MKDNKVKGLPIGFKYWSMLAGPAAYASATQIGSQFKILSICLMVLRRNQRQGQHCL